MPKKLAFIIFLAAVGTAGVLVWLAEIGGSHAADQLAGELPAGLMLQHEGGRLTLSGGLRLRSPRLMADGRDVPLLSAHRLQLNAVTPLAALRWLRDPAATPTGIRLSADNADTSTVAALAPLQLLQGSGLVPFETLGCRALADFWPSMERNSRFNPKRNRMTVEWHRDAALGQVSIALRHAHTELGNIDIHADFKPASRGHAYGITRLQLDQEDLGYLAWRNQTCAEAMDGTVPQWLHTHLNELSSTLAQADIRLSDATLDLYRSYVEQGGKLRVSLLPDADLEWQHWWIYPRTQLFRLLNITARLDDDPPIMVGMEFTELQRVPAVVLDELDALVGSDSDSWPLNLPHVVISRVEPQVPTNETAQIPESTEKVAQPHAAPPASTTAPIRDPDALPASTNAPAPGSDAALVWNPDKFEPLPKNTAAQPRTAISLPQLDRHRGVRVRVLTQSGRRIEGRIDGIHEGQLLLRVLRASGHAQLKIPTDSIVQVQSLGGPATKSGD